MNRSDILLYVKKNYSTLPDYPFKRDPECAALRHTDTRKWYGLLMCVSKETLGLGNVGKADILNLKCDPLLMGSLKNRKEILPAYHMNKEHWITIVLDAAPEAEMVFNLLNLSHELTR